MVPLRDKLQEKFPSPWNKENKPRNIFVQYWSLWKVELDSPSCNAFCNKTLFRTFISGGVTRGTFSCNYKLCLTKTARQVQEKLLVSWLTDLLLGSPHNVISSCGSLILLNQLLHNLSVIEAKRQGTVWVKKREPQIRSILRWLPRIS